MDFAHPVQAVIPGTQGRVFAVLSETTAELNLRTVARREIDHAEAIEKLSHGGQLWGDIARDGVVVHGLTLDELRGVVRA